MNGLLPQRQHTVEPLLPPTGGAGLAVPGGGAKVVPLFRDAADARDDAARRDSGADEPLVLRRRLFDRLARAGDVTTVSGPAGAGKTWLVRSWIADANLASRAAWTTVGREERDGQRFWASVIDALVFGLMSRMRMLQTSPCPASLPLRARRSSRSENSASAVRITTKDTPVVRVPSA